MGDSCHPEGSLACGNSDGGSESGLVCIAGHYAAFGACDAGTSCKVIAPSFGNALVCLPPGVAAPPGNDCADYFGQPSQVNAYATVGASCLDAVSVAEGPELACTFEQSQLVCSDGGYILSGTCAPESCVTTWGDVSGCVKSLSCH